MGIVVTKEVLELFDPRVKTCHYQWKVCTCDGLNYLERCGLSIVMGELVLTEEQIVCDENSWLIDGCNYLKMWMCFRYWILPRWRKLYRGHQWFYDVYATKSEKPILCYTININLKCWYWNFPKLIKFLVSIVKDSGVSKRINVVLGVSLLNPHSKYIINGRFNRL